MCILQTRTYPKEGPMELKFKVMKIKYTNGESSKSRSTNWGHLSGYQVYYVYSHENIKNGSSSFVYSADDSKVSLTVWAKYLGESERSYLFLSENAMDY